MYARVIIDITHEKLDRVFEYRVPEDLEGRLETGMEVLVPFGRGDKETKGYVTGISEQCGYDPEKIKEIIDVSGQELGIEARLVALAAWMKEHYGGTMIQSLKTVLPVKKKTGVKEKRYLKRIISLEEGEVLLEIYLHKNQKARARLLAALLDDEVIDYELAAKKLHITKPVVDALAEKNVLRVEKETVYRNPMEGARRGVRRDIRLTEEQKAAVETFGKDYEAGDYKTYLIYGITGSGKTEVYMSMIEKAVSVGRQAIVLIPEIALTYQTMMWFYQRFGERVSVMHSRLSDGERYDQMERARKGDIDVMIGPRSALFTPFPDLGLIVMDEEHENSYKSEQVPRFHARETAIERARIEHASVVLGSATPSLEARYRAERGEYKLLKLKKRAGDGTLPEVETADMREELRKGNRSILSDRLRELLADRLDKGQQAMLFLNRRGYSGFLSCRSCGYVVKCPHCDVSLSAHRNGILKCHYCGYETSAITVCPSCGSPHIGGFKAGTQQIEDMIKKEFPQARVLRMDLDTTREKDGYEKILSAFSEGEADILIGTQMIVKGHDFPAVTLVGILAADMSLYAGDYRSGERTFQLLVQAAGRAGRGDMPGRVVIQTYSPDHYCITCAAEQDYDSFYKEEMHYRSLMGYPPVSHLAAVWLSGEDEAALEKGAHYLAEYVKLLLERSKGTKNEFHVEVIGPSSPYIGKVKDVYRRVLYLKGDREAELIWMKNKMEQYIEINSGYRKIRVQFDFDPMNIG